MQEQESRFKAKREKYGSSFGQSSGQGGALRSGKSPLDYLGYYKVRLYETVSTCAASDYVLRATAVALVHGVDFSASVQLVSRIISDWE